MINHRSSKRFCLVLLLGLLPLFANASEEKLDESPIPTDRASIQRGAEEVVTTCGGCHGLKYVKYSDLLTLGFAKDKVDGWRGPLPLDAALKPQMSADDATASFGVAPPDLSLMAAAREGGGHYLYSYLTGYHINDKGELTNSVFPVTRMPDVLGLSGITDPKQRAEMEEKAKDVSAFLIWAADPHAQERKHLGYYVLAYVFVMTILLFLWKKQIWHDIDRQPKIE
ncbi:MAG: cytochrome C [Sideroxydans sp.]|nr:cytochrome C [Sideroxydans sp.]